MVWEDGASNMDIEMVINMGFDATGKNNSFMKCIMLTLQLLFGSLRQPVIGGGGVVGEQLAEKEDWNRVLGRRIKGILDIWEKMKKVA